MALLGTWRRFRPWWLAVIPDSECLVLPFVVVAAVGNDYVSKGSGMKIRLGVDIACRSPHHGACADENGTLLWSGHRFRTDVADLEALWARLPGNVDEVMVVMEPTRNAWVPLAAWFRRQGAVVVLVPSEQSSDLRDYFSKHTKTDRLDAELLARLPVLHPEGLHLAQALGPGDPLKRAVKIRTGLVHRRSTAMARLDSLLEILGPGWIDTLGTRMTGTTFKFLAAYANPHQVKRLGAARLARWFQHHSRKAWGPERAAAIIAAAESTLALWGNDGLDFEALAADIAAEAGIALELSEQIALLDRRIHDLYAEADPDGIVMSAPGVGNILAGQILGRLGDPHRFTSLAAARAFSGLVPKRNASGLTDHAGGPTKRGDACLRAALFQAADRARKVDPTLAARYQRLMCDTGRHHNSATCTIATMLLTRIVACLRSGTRYELRDLDGTPITAAQGRALVTKRHQIPTEIRAARRSISKARSAKRRDERAKKGVAKRSETPPVPTPASVPTTPLDNG
jgi:transposase